jgi:hypothetical protein
MNSSLFSASKVQPTDRPRIGKHLHFEQPGGLPLQYPRFRLHEIGPDADS